MSFNRMLTAAILIGAALEAGPRVYVSDETLMAAFEGLDPAEVFRTSVAALTPGAAPASAFVLEGAAGVAVEPLRAAGHKCARCWRVLEEVRPPTLLCERCEDAVAAWDKAHG